MDTIKWARKRKRGSKPGDTPQGLDASRCKESSFTPSESPANASSDHKDKYEMTSDHYSSKHYYECEICDLGGKLLCCDTCPQTYHLQCLDPPLKRIPQGMWKCPTCCLECNSHDKKKQRASLNGKASSSSRVPLMENHTSPLVDKILGCRDQNNVANNSSPITADETNGLSPKKHMVPIPNIYRCTAETKQVDIQEGTNPDLEGRSKDPILPASVSSSGVSDAYEFLVKWAGKSHLHNSWISESQLTVFAKRKLDNYKEKYGTEVVDLCDEQWKKPQRVIALRPSKCSISEVYVKWTGLDYSECTWESIDEPVIANSSRLIDVYNQFENQAVEKDVTTDDGLRGNDDRRKSEVVSLSEQPRELVGGALYPHQLEALNWLRKCWYKWKDVILADEMGLGKTVSAIAFLSSVNFEFKARQPCLVVVPLSTMPNWMDEFTSWAPQLNVVQYHGPAKARVLIRQHEWHASDPSGSNKKTASYKFNVLLTNYETVLADFSYLCGVPWEVLLVDEGHRLKDTKSKLFNLLNSCSSNHRVLLTGTPLQNNIGEMYSLLNFVQPMLFPSISSFEEKFKDLTTLEKVEELKNLVAPHMLRRLKKDVMQSIPPKIEHIVPVELSSIQAEYYRAFLTKNYKILRSLRKGVAQKSILNILMQLRKVCNHPYLIEDTEPKSGEVKVLHDMRIKASGKLALLHSMLKVLHKEGHRVLLFSQMTKLLDILEEYLNIEFGDEAYERIDGSVTVSDRQAAIARFNKDKRCFVFLLSTRSCGLGINLATADTVIIFDSDFNPHADIQAMNRAHRIGQSNSLLVYRLVVRASVEERILQLAKRKLSLDQLLVSKSGSQKEVEDILRWGTEELFSDSFSTSRTYSGENSGNGDESVMHVESKRRRKNGALGDIYNDKCTNSSSKIVWDEKGIQKLLDRSNLQASISDNGHGNCENDILGSIKLLDLNEPAEGQEESGLLNVVTCDNSLQHLEKKDENAAPVTEENEWDKLLQMRWEIYRIEEEAALGRGKRHKKAASYKELHDAYCTRTASEQSGADKEQVREQTKGGQGDTAAGTGTEEGQEYTAAGPARKEKYSRLRAKQKERLARRAATSASGLAIPFLGFCSPNPNQNAYGPKTNGFDDNIQPSCTHMEQLSLKRLGASSSGSVDLNCSSSFYLQQHEDAKSICKSSADVGTSASTTHRGASNLEVIEAAESSSSTSKLPRWLRDALFGPAKPDSRE